MKNERYLRICRKLTPGLEIQISFLLSAGKLFEQFVQFFQVEGPLVHLFHQQMLETTLSIMRRFLKNRVVAGKSSTELMTIDLECEENLLPLEKMEIGVPTRELLKKDSQKPLLFQMRKFYQTGADYLQSHFPIDNTLLMDLSCLDPLARKKGTEINIEKIGRIAMQMPQIVKPADVALVTDEWRLYKYDNEIKTEWYVKEETSGKLKYNRVDEYWNLLFQLKTSTGQLKYSNLAKVVKTALCLAHGNADVERSLSLNKKTLSTDRTLLKPVTINGLRTVKDAVKMCSGDPTLVPVTEEMINAVKHAYQVHQERLKKEAKKAETAKRQKEKDMENAKRCKEEERAMKEKKNQIVNIENLLKESEDQEQEELTTAHKLLEEANKRLTTSLKVKDFNGASVAQSFIEIASNRLESARKQMEQTRKKRKQVDTKKQQLIDAFVPSKKSKYST